MEALCATPSHDVLCPRITVLNIDGPWNTYSDTGETTKAQGIHIFRSFFESRSLDKETSTLKELTFGLDTAMGIEEASEYSKLVEVVFYKGNRLV